jgi:hypothetical protein
MKTDSINNFQKTIRPAVRRNRILIRGNQKWKCMNLNHSLPNFMGLIKIHEGDASIRPAMNFRIVPSYNLNKFLTYILESYTCNAFNETAPSSVTYLLTYSMEQSPSWEANSKLCSLSRNSPHLWNLKVPHRTHKCPPPVPILSQLHPVPTTSSNFLKPSSVTKDLKDLQMKTQNWLNWTRNTAKFQLKKLWILLIWYYIIITYKNT